MILWERYSNRLGISKQSYFSYYNGYHKAIGIEFDMIKTVTPIGLEDLRKVDPCFQPPQIYRYVTNEDIVTVLSKRIK